MLLVFDLNSIPVLQKEGSVRKESTRVKKLKEFGVFVHLALFLSIGIFVGCKHLAPEKSSAEQTLTNYDSVYAQSSVGWVSRRTSAELALQETYHQNRRRAHSGEACYIPRILCSKSRPALSI